MLSPAFLLAVLSIVETPAAHTEQALWIGEYPGKHSTDDKLIPTITAYRVEPGKANGTAVIICPGGGYSGRAADHEGTQVAKWLNDRGVTAIILKYRTVNELKVPAPLGDAPLLDAQRAIRLVRQNAKAIGVDPKKIGIWGFSAGGHLASTAATHFDAGDPKAVDLADRESSRPDFAILAYPVITMGKETHGGSKKNLLGDKPDEKMVKLYSNEKHVTKETPPTFLFHTKADTAVLLANSELFHAALKKHEVPCELYVVEKGKHGVGLGQDAKWTGGEPSVADWPNKLEAWMKTQKLLGK